MKDVSCPIVAHPDMYDLI